MMNRHTAWTAVLLLTLGVAGMANAERIGTQELAEAVDVAAMETYRPGHGSVVTVGVLESNTDRLLEKLQVALIVRDAAGEELGRKGAQTLLLAPGGWGTFRLVFKEKEFPEWDSIEPLVWRARAHPGAATPSLEASVDSETTDPRSSYIHEVHGQVTNTDDRALEWVGVEAAFYDADDRLIAVGRDSVGAKLEPGASDSFKIGINTAGGEVARTEVRADAHPVERK